MTDFLSAHARVRMQQRGVCIEALEDVLSFGREAFDHHGGIVVFLDKAAKRRLKRNKGKAGSKALGLYAVIGADGLVKTVGHRYQRIRRR